MEPFRPIVDRATAYFCQKYGPFVPLDKKAKEALLEPLLGRFEVKSAHTAKTECRTLFDIAGHTAASLSDVYLGKRKTLVLPEG
jgi:hypothetical protein